MDPMLAARRIIFSNHNDPEVAFTNDQILDEMKDAGLVAGSLTIHDMEETFRELCASGLARNIAQNFTTIWLKLFDVMAEADCPSCGVVHLGGLEARACPACDRHITG